MALPPFAERGLDRSCATNARPTLSSVPAVRRIRSRSSNLYLEPPLGRYVYAEAHLGGPRATLPSERNFRSGFLTPTRLSSQARKSWPDCSARRCWNGQRNDLAG